MRIGVVLVNYRQAALTIECIRSLEESTTQGVSAIIVDNCSGDDSTQRIRGACPESIVIESPENNGFASGCNIGIRYALEHGAEYVLLLNNDTVIAPDMIDFLLDNADDRTVTTPKMYYFGQPDVLWFAGGYIDRRKGSAVHFGENERDVGQYDVQREIEFATGCCMLIPRAVLESCPLMDEHYFLYWEDVDYSMMLTQRGIRLLYCPNAKLWHKVNASTGKNSLLTEYYSNRNRFYLLNKYHFNRIGKGYTYLTRLIKWIRGCLVCSNERVILKAYLDYCKGMMGKRDIH